MKAAQQQHKRFEYALDPSAVMELGYALHVVDDPLSAGTKARRLAEQLIDALMAARAPEGSPDHVYLCKARAIILSLGRGITRRKMSYRHDMEAADSYRALELSRIDSERTQSFWSNLLYRTLLSGGIGFALMESLLPFVHLHFQHNGSSVQMTGLAPSMLLALIFAAGSKVAFSKLEDIRYRSVFQHYEWIRLQAIHGYERGKLKEFERNYVEIKRVWRDYTGRDAPRSVTFATVIADGIRTQEWLERERNREMAGLTKKLVMALQTWRASRVAKQKEKANARRAVLDRQVGGPFPHGPGRADADLQPMGRLPGAVDLPSAGA